MSRKSYFFIFVEMYKANSKFVFVWNEFLSKYTEENRKKEELKLAKGFIELFNKIFYKTHLSEEVTYTLRTDIKNKIDVSSLYPLNNKKLKEIYIYFNIPDKIITKLNKETGEDIEIKKYYDWGGTIWSVKTNKIQYKTLKELDEK